MAISKKVCAKAVGRNRIKRIVRENFRTTMAGIISDKALDFVVMATRTAKHQNNKALDESLSIHWQKLTSKADDRNTGHRSDQSRTQR
jgi:ribonuclease P protein component